MSFTLHRLWPDVRPYIKIEKYTREGGTKNARIRIELKGSTPTSVKARALRTTMPCVACGKKIHPFRKRSAPSKRSESGHVYYAATCPLDINLGCSRGKAAREEYNHIGRILS